MTESSSLQLRNRILQILITLITAFQRGLKSYLYNIFRYFFMNVQIWSKIKGS